MGWAEDRFSCRNQDSSTNLADFADRFFKIELKPDFKEESELKKIKLFFPPPFRVEFKTLPDLKQWGFFMTPVSLWSPDSRQGTSVSKCLEA